MDFRLRPAGKYMLEADLEDIYKLTEHWKTDMEFYRDEIRFLMDLISRYAALVITENHTAKVKSLQKQLSNAESQLNNLNEKVEEHIADINDLIEGVMRVSEITFRIEHTKLENEVANF